MDSCRNLSIALGLVLVLTVLSAGCLKESRLGIQGMNVGADEVGTARTLLNVTTEIVNHQGFSRGETRVRLQAFSTGTGLIEAERTDPVAGIGWGGSRSVTQTLDLPRSGSYRLVSTVFEGEREKARGEITVYNLERLVPDSEQSLLSIGDIDFIAKKVSGDSVELQADISVTNEDTSGSGPFEIEVKAKELDAHLVADKQRVTVDSIPPGKTVVPGVRLTVPDQYNYSMEVLFWRNGTIIKRGEGTVQLRPGSRLPAGEEFVTRKIETSKFVQSDGDMATLSAGGGGGGGYGGSASGIRAPGFPVPLAIGGLVIAAILAGRRLR